MYPQIAGFLFYMFYKNILKEVTEPYPGMSDVYSLLLSAKLIELQITQISFLSLWTEVTT